MLVHLWIRFFRLFKCPRPLRTVPLRLLHSIRRLRPEFRIMVDGVGNAPSLCRYSPIFRGSYDLVPVYTPTIEHVRTLSVRSGHLRRTRTSSDINAPP